MPSAPRKRRSLRGVVVAGLITGAGLVFAAPASAAVMTTTVTPSQVTVNHYFRIKVAGIGNPDDESQRVLAWTQPRTPTCKSTYLANYIAIGRRSPKIAEDVGTFPFSITSIRIKANVLGKRRVCAYLYSVDTHATLLVSTARYTVVLPLCHRRGQRNCRRH
jgi:hypothetical protein